MQGPLPPNQGTDDYEILFHTTGPYDNSMLGFSLCSAGDQNGDGYDDIIAYCDNPPEVLLYYGGYPMDTIPDVVFPTQPGWSGFFPLELADLNYDGDTDIVFGWEPNSFYQEVYVYYGGAILDTIKDWILISDNTYNAHFGYGMSCGYINGDCITDLVIGASGYDIPGNHGKIFFYFGSTEFDSIPDFSITSGFNDFGDLFGGYASSSGDINNDGYNEISTIWSKAYDPIYLTGAYLFYGGNELDSIPDWTYSLPYYINGYNTRSATIIKDLNNDEYDELAIITSEGFGRETHLFFGSDFLSNTPDMIIEGSSDAPQKCVSAGDVNADGYNDMIIGGYDDWVKVYFGGDPMDGVADITFYMDDAGIDVDFAGDVNNDGIYDFMFGANDDQGLDAGQILIYSDPSLIPHVEPRNEDEFPSSFTLNQNFPNPFNGVTVIPFQSNQTGDIKLNIYNILGQSVYYAKYSCTFGEYVRVLWDGKDLSGNVLPSGLYFAELIADEYRETIKMEILR